MLIRIKEKSCSRGLQRFQTAQRLCNKQVIYKVTKIKLAAGFSEARSLWTKTCSILRDGFELAKLKQTNKKQLVEATWPCKNK